MKKRNSSLFMLTLLFLTQNFSIAQTDFFINECTDSIEVIEKVDEVLLGEINPQNKKNIIFKGDPRSVGYYTGGELFGFSKTSGIVMSTGFAGSIDKSNDCAGQNASSNTSGGGDIDLNKMSGVNIYDGCIIEFDVMFFNDSAYLSYLFGSEEYHEFVNFFNDVFGIFMSGPSISGPYSNDSKNIAVIPGTENEIKINSVNCGYHSPGCNIALIGGPNCDLLIDNTNTFGESYSECAFDAFTIPLHTRHHILSGQWYHVKLAVGDANDAVWDSAILLESGAIVTGRKDLQFSALFSFKPNPARDYIEIDYAEAGSLKEIVLYDLNGKAIKRQPFERRILLNDAPVGLLIIEIISENNTLRSKLVHF